MKKKLLLYLLTSTLFGAEKPPTTVYLVRHGQTEWNKRGLLQGQIDIPLNDAGRSEAAQLNQKLHAVNFGACYSSDLLRATETARILIGPRHLALKTDQRLRERMYGPWEGRAPGEFLNALAKGESQAGVESDEAILDRVLPALYEIANANTGAHVLVVTHGGVLRVLLTQLLELGDSTRRDLKVHNMALLQLAFSEGQCQIQNLEGVELPAEKMSSL